MQTQSIALVKKAAKAAGAHIEIVGNDLSEQSGFKPLRTLRNTPSAMYDAIYIVGGGNGVSALGGDDDAVKFVREAYKHGKAIAACGNASAFVTGVLSKADAITAPTNERRLVLSDAHANKAFAEGFLEAAANRHWGRGPQMLPPSPAQ